MTQILLYIKIVWVFIKRFYKLFLVAAVALLCLWVYLLIQNNKALRSDSERFYTNLQNASFQVRELTAQNGKTFYAFNQLSLKANELELVNKGLTNQITNLNIKIKNITAATALALLYNIRIDSIPIYISDTTPTIGRVTYDDTYVSLAGVVDWKEKSFEDINICVVEDSLLLVTETIYKGWWLFRKPKYTTIKVASSNPYLILRNAESYNLKFD